jgi:hypothetical protein
MNIWKKMFLALVYRLLEILIQALIKPRFIFNKLKMSF